MVTMSLKASEADFKNYYDIVKKIKALEAKESLTIEEKEQLSFYKMTKYRFQMNLEVAYGYHPNDDAIEMPTFLYNTDYTECEHNGIKYEFIPMQANVVKFMHAEIQKGNKVILQSDILAATNSEGSNLRDIFKRNRIVHLAWKVLIKKVKNNYYTLDINP